MQWCKGPLDLVVATSAQVRVGTAPLFTVSPVGIPDPGQFSDKSSECADDGHHAARPGHGLRRPTATEKTDDEHGHKVPVGIHVDDQCRPGYQSGTACIACPEWADVAVAVTPRRPRAG